MLLRIARKLSRRVRRKDEGAALIAVMGLMVVSLLVVTLVVSTVIAGIGRSTAVRAGVQSQAAAEAGIDAARAAVDSNTCTSSLIDNSAVTATVRYKVQIAWRSSASRTWANQCPSMAGRGQVKYTATGWASSNGVAGQSSGDKSHVEAVYGANSVTTPTVGTGAAIYAWGTTGSSGLGNGVGLLNTLAVGGPKASIQIYNGDANCSGLALNTSANWVIRNGAFTQNQLCLTINGDVTASGSVTQSGALLGLIPVNITGNVTAGRVSMNGLASVTGNIWSYGAVTGATTGFLGNVSGTVVRNATTPPIRWTTPTVPGWVDYDYTGPSGWPGYSATTLAAASCNSASARAAILAFGSAKGLIDAQACTNGSFLNDLTIADLQNDVAFIVPNTQNVQIGGIAVTAGSHDLTIIQPDSDITDGRPTCPAGGGLTMTGINVVFPHLMVYTPCTYTENGGILGVLTFTGQIYAGKADLGNGLVSARVQNYAPVGIPGVDLAAGTITATGPRALISSRNVATGP